MFTVWLFIRSKFIQHSQSLNSPRVTEHCPANSSRWSSSWPSPHFNEGMAKMLVMSTPITSNACVGSDPWTYQNPNIMIFPTCQLISSLRTSWCQIHASVFDHNLFLELWIFMGQTTTNWSVRGPLPNNRLWIRWIPVLPGDSRGFQCTQALKNGTLLHFFEGHFGWVHDRRLRMRKGKHSLLANNPLTHDSQGSD